MPSVCDRTDAVRGRLRAAQHRAAAGLRRSRAIGSTETGIASWYGVPYDGRPTASGEIFDMRKLTAAHRALPFQTWVEVTNLSNGKQVDVRIIDRGPFVRGRIIDLSMAAARQIECARRNRARPLEGHRSSGNCGSSRERAGGDGECARGEARSGERLRNRASCRQVRRSGGSLLRSLARRSLARGASLRRCESGRATGRTTGSPVPLASAGRTCPYRSSGYRSGGRGGEGGRGRS